MQYRSLGRYRREGQQPLSGLYDVSAAEPKLMNHTRSSYRSLDAGINFLDTANVYSLWAAASSTFGKALKERGSGTGRPRHQGPQPHGQARQRLGNSRRHIIEQCDMPRRLQTDYIDLYQMHRPMPEIPIDETLRALDDLVREGKVRYIGTSTFAAWQIMEALWVSKEFGLNRFVCEQPPYNLLDRRIERELVPMAQTYGLGIMAWSPLAGGFLTGKYHRGEPPARGRPVRLKANSMQRRRLTDRVYDVIEGLQPIAAEQGNHAFPARPRPDFAPARRNLPDHWTTDHGAVRGQPRRAGRDVH